MLNQLKPLNYYDIFGLDRGASTQEVNARYEQLKQIYESSHFFMRGLMNEKELYIYNILLDHIVRIIGNPELRKEYDMEIHERTTELKSSFPETFDIQEIVRRYEKNLNKTIKTPVPHDVYGRETPVERPNTTVDSYQLQKTLEQLAESKITGENIKQIREAAGISLQALSDKTRISRFILSAIEQEDFKGLPAAIYVRGFLENLCRTLRIPSDYKSKIVSEYMERMKAASMKPNSITEE